MSEEMKVNYSRVLAEGFTVTEKRDAKDAGPSDRREVTMVGDVAIAAKLSLAQHFLAVLDCRRPFQVASLNAITLFREAMDDYATKLIDLAAESQKQAEFRQRVGVEHTHGTATAATTTGVWSSVPPVSAVHIAPKKKAKKAKRGADS